VCGGFDKDCLPNSPPAPLFQKERGADGVAQKYAGGTQNPECETGTAENRKSKIFNHKSAHGHGT